MGTPEGVPLLAKFQLYGADELSKQQRKEISKWLKEQAKQIVREGNNYSTQFKAAYYWKK